MAKGRAKGREIYELRGGEWGPPTPKAPFGSIRKSGCFNCDSFAMTVTPQIDGSVKAICNACGAQGWLMIRAAEERYEVSLSAPDAVKRKLAAEAHAKRKRTAAYGKLSPSARAVVDLFKRLSTGKPNAFAKTLDDLSVATGWSVRTMSRALAKAEAAGQIIKRPYAYDRGDGVPLHIYMLAGLPDDSLLLRKNVEMARSQKKVAKSTWQAIGIIESANPVRTVLKHWGASTAPTDALNAESGASTIDGLAEADTTTLASSLPLPGPERSPSRRHYPAGAALPSDGSALPLDADIAERCISAREGTAHYIREAAIHSADLFAAEFAA
ncbi:MAG: hypothetical protein ACLQJR_20360, partial [Stellaceae bacterium]